MQMVPRKMGRQLDGELGACAESARAAEEVLGQPMDDHSREEARQPESLELARVRSFCSSILKTLAPPLLSEFERTTGLRADAEPFTPRRVNRRSAAAIAGT
jgi:hypothetical protein